MQRSRKSPERRTASLQAKTNNESASRWGNGLTAETVHSPTVSSPSIGSSFLGIGQDLTTNPISRKNTSRTWDSWAGSAAGGGYGGTLANDAGTFGMDLGVGLGLGGGGGGWSQTSDGRKSQGYGASGALGGRVDANFYGGGSSAGFGGDLYTGVGGNAYSFDEANGRSGVGIDAGYTPFGINDGYTSIDTPWGSQSASVGQLEVGRQGGTLEAWSGNNDSFGVNGDFSLGRTVARDINSTTTTSLGTTTAGVGEISQGRFYQGSAGRDENGRYNASVKQGGALTVNNAHVDHDWGNGMSSSASLGRFGANETSAEVGWNPETRTFDAQGVYSTGRRINDLNFATDLPGGGNFSGGVDQIQTGSQYRLDRSTIGPDGVHLAGGGHHNDGIEIQNAHVSGGWDGVYSGDASVGRFSNRTQVDGASLDIDGNGVRAGVDQLRTGGFVATDLEANSNVLGMNQHISAGEVSNDFLLNGANLNIDGSGVHAGFDELDFGGVRVKDVAYNNDLGGYGNVDAGLGSFTNGNSIKGANLDITGDGVSATVESFGVAGTDIENAHVNLEGPGGLHANAGLERYHSGISGENAYAEINGNGINLGAERLSYDQHSVDGVELGGGIDGIYESNLSLGHGHMNHASAENLNLSLDGDGLGLSADNVNYSYLGVEDFQASQSFGDGAVTTNLGLGRGDYLGGSADHINFQSNLLNQSLQVENLNAHGLQLEDLEAGVTVGDAGLNVGADRLDVLNLDVGSIDAESRNFGTSGHHQIEDANLDLINAEGLGGGLTYGDTTVLGAQTDLNASVGADYLRNDWDLMSGTASTEFENARATLMTDNTRLEAFGHGIDIGRTGADIRATGGGEVDLSRGAASGDVNFAGTELALFGNSVELGDWAQASGGVDISQGQANFNVGGENGVGADVDIGEGNLDLHAFGHTLDVDEAVSDGIDAVKDGAEWVGDRAVDVGRGIVNTASTVGNAIADTASNVGSAISSGASKAWDVITSW